MRRFFTEQEKAYIHEHYADVPTSEIAAYLQRSLTAVYNFACRNHLHKSPECVAQMSRERMADMNHPGRKYHFKKGIIPANKGKKQEEWMKPEALEKNKKARFKKGNVPANYRPIGSERVSGGYIEVKTHNGRRWSLKHRVIWEQVNGPIPEGMNVCFKDGNKMNVDISNLHLLSNEENMENNSIQRYPKELRDVIQLSGRIKNKIKKLEKNGK